MSTGRASHVFISYSRTNTAFVNRLVGDLQRQGITVWVDQSGLQPGTPDWETALRIAISKAHAVILIASEEARKSPYVKDELRLAHDVHHLPIYPLWVAGTQWINCIPLGWGGTQYIDARGDEAHYQSAIQQLVAALSGARPVASMAPLSYTYSLTANASQAPGQTQQVCSGKGLPTCLIATVVSLLVVGVLLFALAIPIFNFVSHLINTSTNSFPGPTGFPTSAPAVSGTLHVTPTSFNTTRTEGTLGGCFYFSGQGWTCTVTLQDTSSTGDVMWSTKVSPDSVTLSESVAIVPLTPGASQTVAIKIPDSYCGHSDVTFKGPINSVDVTIDCS